LAQRKLPILLEQITYAATQPSHGRHPQHGEDGAGKGRKHYLNFRMGIRSCNPRHQQ
jgi:hypothetical protein